MLCLERFAHLVLKWALTLSTCVNPTYEYAPRTYYSRRLSLRRCRHHPKRDNEDDLAPSGLLRSSWKMKSECLSPWSYRSKAESYKPIIYTYLLVIIQY